MSGTDANHPLHPRYRGAARQHPTAQEIADQLPDDGDMYRVTIMGFVPRSYLAYNHDVKKSPTGEGDTMAEALAALYLKLNDTKGRTA